MPHPVSQVSPRLVRRIVHKPNPAGGSILSELGASQVQQRPKNFRFRIKTGESPRTGITKDSHEDSFDLIVERMSRSDGSAKLFRGRPQKIPPCLTPLVLFAERYGRTSGNTFDSQDMCLTLDETSCGRGMAPTAMVESGDENVLWAGSPHRSNGVQKNHRIETAGHREHNPIGAFESRRCVPKHFRFFIRPDPHGILNLTTASLE